MTVYYQDATLTLLHGDAIGQLRTLPDGSVNCCVTSPPYFGLRDYNHPDQIGLEATPAEYVAALVEVFAEVHRVLATDGTCWLNLGDSYSASPPGKTEHGMRSSTLDSRQAAETLRESVRSAGVDRTKFLPAKNLMGMPWRVVFALQDAGWFLRNAIVWDKPNAMPESVQDRLSNRYELLFLLTKSNRYWFDLDPIRESRDCRERKHRNTYAERRANGEPSRHGLGGMRSAGAGELASHPHGANPGDLWEIATRPYSEAHFATFPIDLPRRCILAGCKPGGTVLDPFSGAGTTAMAAQQLGRKAIGIDLVAKYHDMALRRMSDRPLPLEDGEAS